MAEDPAAPGGAAVTLTGVTKRFGTVVAVDSLDLTIPRGSIYGFIGPNGSGKTTTIRMILHILLPDAGTIEVLGKQGPRAANDRIGYLPEERGLYRKLTVRRQLEYFASLKGKPPRTIRPEIERWLERFDLAEWADRRVETLSKGMSQKVQFISTMLTRPDLLILDEPFSGLDPVNTEVLREAVVDLRRAGATIIFSTHDMAMAEHLCDAVFMIFRGRKVLDGAVETITREHGEDVIRVRFDRSLENRDALRTIPGVVGLRDLGREVELRFEGPPEALLPHLAAVGNVRRFEVVRPSLLDIFLRRASADSGQAETEIVREFAATEEPG